MIALAFALALAVLAPAAGAADPMVDRINSVRHKHDLPGLRSSGSLTRSAGSYARHLLRVDRFGHSSRIRASGFRSLGEILALNRGYNARRSSTIRNWLRSPMHRSVILSRSFSYVGAAAVRGHMGRGRSTVWVVQFGRR